MKKTIFLSLIIIFSLLIIPTFSRAWTEPTGFPPTNNIAAPLTGSATTEYKIGSLFIKGDSTASKGLNLGTDSTLSSFLQLANATDNLLYGVIDYDASLGKLINFQTARGGIYTSRLVLTKDGKVGINQETPEYNLHVNGSFAAQYKNFDIADPRYNNSKIRLIHSSIEGPEHAVYYRGEAKLKNGKITIKLPSYFEALTRDEGRTLLLTCKNGWSPLYGDGDIKDGQFTVKTTSIGNSSQTFYWEVKAVRADIPILDTLKVIE